MINTIEKNKNRYNNSCFLPNINTCKILTFRGEMNIITKKGNLKIQLKEAGISQNDFVVISFPPEREGYISRPVKRDYWWKRPFDILFSTLAIIVFSPVMLIIALAIKLTDGGSVIYKQRRIGKNGEEFTIYKFRTMYMDSDERLRELLRNNPELREEWNKCFKLKNDPRITPIGRILRKTSLDELPQFFNVLKGDMSIVGPRPVVKEELERFYKEKAIFYKSVKPGITGFWQVECRSDVEDYEERVKMDEWYVKNQSFLFDMKIILKTIKVMLTGKGAY